MAEKMSRRSFIKRSALLTSGLIAGAAGLHVARTELLPPYGITLSSEGLLFLALKRVLTQPEILFGPQALERDTQLHDPVWGAVDRLSSLVGREDLIGAFGDIDDFAYGGSGILLRLNEIHERGSLPMANLGIGGKIDGKHPLAQTNRVKMQAKLQKALTGLSSLGVPHLIRLGYEFNGGWFVYGRDQGLSGAAHERGMRQLFIDASRLASVYDPLGRIVISPNVGAEIIAYTPLREKQLPMLLSSADESRLSDVFGIATPRDEDSLNQYLERQSKKMQDHMGSLIDTNEDVLLASEDRIALAGLDGYIWFPGKGKLTRDGYWVPGHNITAESLFLHSYIDLCLSYADLPKMASEAGAISLDPEVIFRMFLLFLSLGSSGFMPFIVNKKEPRGPMETHFDQGVRWVEGVGRLEEQSLAFTALNLHKLPRLTFSET